MIEIEVDAGAALSLSDSGPDADGEMTQERDARLLEAGSYPDKGLTVTEADLDGIVARFGAMPAGAVPVKVEHRDTPLDPLGQVRRIWREGAMLRARLAFPPDLAAFLRRRGAAKLSVGLRREPDGPGALSLAEVSLVLRPRVASAAVTMGEREVAMAEGVTMGDAREAEIGRLRAELTARDVAAQVASLKAAGRIVPATEGLARALLATPAESRITLSEGAVPEPVAGVFRRFLEAMPPAVRFGETAPGASASDPAMPDAPLLTEDEQAWLRDTLGLDPAQVMAMMRTGQLATGQGT